jgi:two-component system sensor histidine kinase YesM
MNKTRPISLTVFIYIHGGMSMVTALKRGLGKSLFSFRSIQNRIFMSILIFLIIPSLATLYLMGERLQQTIEEKIGASNQEAVNQVGINMEILGSKLINSLIAVSLDDNLTSMVKAPDAYSEYDKMRISGNILRTISNTYLAETGHYITILDFKGGLYTSWYAPEGTYEKLIKEDWYDHLLKTDGQYIWLQQNKNFTTQDTRPLISISFLIQGGESREGYGIAMISIPESEIGKLLLSLQGDSALVDPNGTVLSRPNRTKYGDEWKDGFFTNYVSGGDNKEKHMQDSNIGTTTISRSVNNMGWRVFQFISHGDMFGDIDKIRNANYALISAIFLLFLAISYSISNRISKPIKLLNRRMSAIEDKDFNNTIQQVKGHDEVAGLIRAYNQMLQQIKELLHRLKSEYNLREELRFKMLQAQINPHFILNTLNNIKWMAYLRQNREVGDMLTSLGVIMETSLGKNEKVIPLSKEIDYIHNYITLQKIKYNEKLVVHIDLREPLENCEIIPFILQPIVENSIYHGIERKQGMGQIWVSTGKENDQLVLTVQDDGLGMIDTQLALVQSLLHDDQTEANDHIGIYNVHQRIRLHYGPDYGITIDSVKNEGTIVRIVLPCRQWEGRDDHAQSYDR